MLFQMINSTVAASDSAKRIRVHDTWRRVTRSTPAYTPIFITEMVPFQKLEAVSSSEEFDGMMDDEEKRQFNKWLSHARQGYKFNHNKIVHYMQNDYSHLNVEEYTGCEKIGRMFAKNNLGYSVSRSQNIKKIVRNTLFVDTHYDVDMENCHPTIALWLFRDLKLSSLESYVDVREHWLSEFKDVSKYTGDNLQCAKEIPPWVAKKAVNACLNGSGKYFGFHGDEIGYARTFEYIPFFRSLLNDRDMIYEAFRARYRGLVALAHESLRRANKPTTNAIGKAFSLLLQDVENECLRAMYFDLWQTKDVDVKTEVVFLFDGFLVPKDIVDDMGKEEFLSRMMRAIEDKVGIKMRVRIKDMSENILHDVEFALDSEENQQETVIGQSYGAFKIDFEKQYYRLDNPMCYVRENPDGSRSYYQQTKFVNEVCAEMDKDLVKEWIGDKNKRRYFQEVFAPHPHACPDGSLQVYTGLRATTLPAVDDELVEEMVKPIVQHIEYLCGGSDAQEERDYVLDWLASRIQTPGKLPGVALAFRSVEGVGKDSFFSFFGNKIIGKEYFHQAPEMSELFSDKHSQATRDKLLLVVSECTRMDNKTVRNKMKSFMTAEKVKFRPLYCDETLRDNYCGIVMFGQDQNFLTLDGDDRRFFVVDSSPVKSGSKEYFSRILQIYNDDTYCRAFYQYLMSRDLSGFHFLTSRPQTKARKDMIAFGAKPFYVFLYYYIKRRNWELNIYAKPVVPIMTFTDSRKDFYTAYVEFVREHFNKFQETESRRVFNSNLRCMTIDSSYEVKEGDETTVKHPFQITKDYRSIQIDISKCLEWLGRYVDTTDDTMDLH